VGEYLNLILFNSFNIMRARTEEPKHTFSINLPISLYQKLVDEAGKGKIGIFIKDVLEEKLSKKEENLVNEYQECYSNPRMIKEAKQ
jgi:hypothetical protein